MAKKTIAYEWCLANMDKDEKWTEEFTGLWKVGLKEVNLRLDEVFKWRYRGREFQTE